MNTMLDILGATIIGGLIFLLITNLNTYSSKDKFTSDTELTLQRNAKTLASMIESDLRKVGYNYSGNPIIDADSTRFSFYADIDSNGTVDSLTLTESDTTLLPETQNPKDRIYYRVVDGDTLKAASLGLTKLKFTYKDALGYVTTVPDSIQYIEAEVWLESATKIDTTYAKTYWEITVNPRNL